MRGAPKFSAGLPIALGLFAAIAATIEPANAACVASGANAYVCNPPTAHTTTIGSGPSTASGTTVTLNANAQISVGNANAISLRDNAVITLNTGSLVQNRATSGGGLWGAGNDTVELGSNGYLYIAE